MVDGTRFLDSGVVILMAGNVFVKREKHFAVCANARNRDADYGRLSRA